MIKNSKEITAEYFFQKYTRDKRKLDDLEYKLVRLDDVVVTTTQFRHDKVQTSMQNRLDECILNREEMKKRLEIEIQWIKFEIERAERVMTQIGDRERYRISYLKRRYLDKESYSKIARDHGVSASKVQKVIKETEEFLCFLAR